MKFNPDRFSLNLVKQAGVLSPMLIILAGFLIYFTMDSVQLAFKAVAERSSSVSDQTVVRVDNIALDKAQLRQVAERLVRLSPAVKVTVDDRYITLSVAQSEQFAEFIYSLAQVQFLSPNAVWNAETICLGSCESVGVAAMAKISAVRRSISATQVEPGTLAPATR